MIACRKYTASTLRSGKCEVQHPQPVMSSLLHKTVKQVVLHAVQHWPASCQAFRWTGRLTGLHASARAV